MARSATQIRMDQAIKRVPATIAKPGRGQAPRKERKNFHIYTVSQLLETFRDPRAVLLEIASTDTDKLAEQLGVSMHEALQERRLAAQTVLPYVSQKLPVQVDMRHTRAIVLNMLDKDEYTALESVAFSDPNKAHDIEATIVQAIAEDHASDTPADYPHDTVSQAVNGDDGG